MNLISFYFLSSILSNRLHNKCHLLHDNRKTEIIFISIVSKKDIIKTIEIQPEEKKYFVFAVTHYLYSSCTNPVSVKLI